jgi:acetyl-CoA carboxylase biotin carboxyl carrier protein
VSGLRDLVVGATRDQNGLWLIAAPATGWWTSIPRAGSWLGPLQGPGGLRRLRTDYRLVLPPGVQGRVAEVSEKRRVVAVEYGQPLMRLAAERGVGSADEPTPAIGASSDRPAEGEFSVRAPTAGVFYRRATPDAAPFVEVGATVCCGQAIGLVEVMKTFHHILLEGGDAPARGRVSEIRCDDGDEVTAGQVLVVVRGDVPGAAKP